MAMTAAPRAPAINATAQRHYYHSEIENPVEVQNCLLRIKRRTHNWSCRGRSLEAPTVENLLVPPAEVNAAAWERMRQ